MKEKIILLMILILSLIIVVAVRADEYDDITKQLNDLKASLDSSQRATANNEQSLRKLNSQLDDIKAQVAHLESEIVKKENEVQKGEQELAHQKTLLDNRVVSYYKHLGSNSTAFIQLFLGDDLSTSLKQFFYQKTVMDDDKRAIVSIVMRVKDLEARKAQLAAEKDRLGPIKEEVDRQATFMTGEVTKSKAYESQLQQQIVQLSARQQEILAQRLASLNIPRSAGTSLRGCSDDRGIDPGFSPRIAFFTYGAPHRNGLNQYGAWGRAKSGQNEEQILSEYYPGMSLRKDYDQNTNITTTTGWSGTVEEYTKRIYEVPNSWGDQGGMATLKAQAVAARTYALNSMQRNGSICTTESCQVFNPEPKGGNWEQAVNATAGWVLIDGGNPGFTQYASTHGGYILNLGKFDGAGGNPGSFSELNERAYDRESPWFYCDWGFRPEPEYNKTAWLKPDEVADIVNTLLLVKRDSGTAENLYQTDKANPAGKETWDTERVKSELRARGGTPYDSVTDISVGADFGSGRTTSVNVAGTSFDAHEFKDRFNLRAPANLQIVGPLYNVEKR